MALTPTIQSTIIESNTGRPGGGNPMATMQGSAGGIQSSGTASFTLQSCIVRANTGGNGLRDLLSSVSAKPGGVYAASAASISDTLITANVGGAGGSALIFSGGSLVTAYVFNATGGADLGAGSSVTNATIAGNSQGSCGSCPNTSSGLAMRTTSGTSMTIVNTIVYGNNGSAPDVFLTGAGSAHFTSCNIAGGVPAGGSGTGVIDADPSVRRCDRG